MDSEADFEAVAAPTTALPLHRLQIHMRDPSGSLCWLHWQTRVHAAVQFKDVSVE